MYPLLFLSTSPGGPYCIFIPIIHRSPRFFHLQVRYIKHPISTTTHPVQPEQVIRCSSIAHLVHKTCEQGHASGLKKISTFWRFACGSSFPKGSIFFATLAHTASTLHASAPAHSLRFVWCSAWRGCLFCCTSLAQSSPVATLAPLNPNKVFADAHTLF
jgi:hypothetical protein